MLRRLIPTPVSTDQRAQPQSSLVLTQQSMILRKLSDQYQTSKVAHTLNFRLSRAEDFEFVHDMEI